jgi:SEL1 protein
MRLLTKAAKADNPDAMYLLGELNFVIPQPTIRLTLQYGNYSQANYVEAFKWFQKLAQHDGNSTALHLLGFMYATGIGNAVETDQGAVTFPSCLPQSC